MQVNIKVCKTFSEKDLTFLSIERKVIIKNREELEKTLISSLDKENRKFISDSIKNLKRHEKSITYVINYISAYETLSKVPGELVGHIYYYVNLPDIR